MGTQNLDSADLKGVARGGLIREDVMNKIWDISKIPLPFTDMIGSESSKQEFKEWTTDELQTPNLNNAVVDGSDAVLADNDASTGERVGNHHQISTKIVQVSYRADASDTIGRAKELAYQVMRRQQELRRDIEAIMLSNQASVADDGNATAGKVGTLPSWIKTTHINGTAGGFNTGTGLTVARTPDVAAVGLTETNVKDAIEGVYNNGGDVTRLMTVPKITRLFSEFLFTGNAKVAAITSDQGKSREKAAALGAVNVYISDFGTVLLVPNRLQQTYTATTTAADVFLLDPAYLSKTTLKGYKTEPLAKTGLSEKRFMSVDWSLVVNTEKAHAIIGNIDLATAVAA